MNLLKAIGRTTLSLLKWLLIMSLIIGCIVGTIIMLNAPTIVNIIGSVLIGILLTILVFLIVYAIVMETKYNYEKYARKSTQPKNSYKVDYNIVYKRDRIIKGKTKSQAIESLYNEESEIQTDIDFSYKIIKITEMN